MSGWNIPDFLFAADEIDDLTLSQACETIEIRVITKLPNSEQSYKGKVKTHKYIKRQNQSTNRKTVKTVMTLTWYRHFITAQRFQLSL
jgi:hypothetical protein